MIKGSDIRDARNRAGMSQEALAEAVGVTLRTIGNWERSATVPRNKLPIVREVLGDYLEEGKSQSPRLRVASDEELLKEIARRFARSLQEEGPGSWRDASSEDDDGGGEAGGLSVVPDPPTDDGGGGAAEEELPDAARGIRPPSKDDPNLDPNIGQGSQDDGRMDPS